MSVQGLKEDIVGEEYCFGIITENGSEKIVFLFEVIYLVLING